jgi:hypothetical protein
MYCKVVRNVREVEKERDRINKYNRADQQSCKRGLKQIYRYYRAVRVRYKNKFALAVVFNDCPDFTDYNILPEYSIGYTRAHRYNLKCYYSDLCIISTN